MMYFGSSLRSKARCILNCAKSRARERVREQEIVSDGGPQGDIYLVIHFPSMEITPVGPPIEHSTFSDNDIPEHQSTCRRLMRTQQFYNKARNEKKDIQTQSERCKNEN